MSHTNQIKLEGVIPATLLAFDKDFNINENLKEGVIASTILKIQEKKIKKDYHMRLLNFLILAAYLNFLFFLIFLKKKEKF